MDSGGRCCLSLACLLNVNFRQFNLFFFSSLASLIAVPVMMSTASCSHVSPVESPWEMGRKWARIAFEPHRCLGDQERKSVIVQITRGPKGRGTLQLVRKLCQNHRGTKQKKKRACKMGRGDVCSCDKKNPNVPRVLIESGSGGIVKSNS